MAKSKSTAQKELDAILLTEKRLAEKKMALMAKLSELSDDSPGMKTLLAAVQSTAESNNVSVAEVITAVARIKRTGLKIDKAVRKARTKKTNKPD